MLFTAVRAVRNRRDTPPHATASGSVPVAVRADLALLDRRLSTPGTHAKLRRRSARLDPGAGDCGARVAAFIRLCDAKHILRYDAPVTAVCVRPAADDNGSDVIVGIAGRILVTSYLWARTFEDADDVAHAVLTAVVRTANREFRDFLAAAKAVAACPR